MATDDWIAEAAERISRFSPMPNPSPGRPPNPTAAPARSEVEVMEKIEKLTVRHNGNRIQIFLNYELSAWATLFANEIEVLDERPAAEDRSEENDAD